MRSKILFITITSSIALASVFHYAPVAQATTHAVATPAEKLEVIYGLLGELKAEVDDVRKEWVEAQNAMDALRTESAALKKKIARDNKLRAVLHASLPGTPPTSDIADYQKRLAEIGSSDCVKDRTKELCKAGEIAKAKHKILESSKKRYADYLSLAKIEEAKLINGSEITATDFASSTENFGTIEEEIAASGKRTDSVDPYIAPDPKLTLGFNSDFDGIYRDPNKFMAAPKEVATRSTGNLASRVSSFLFDRSSDRRGSGASLSLTDAESKMTLQFGFNRAGKYIRCKKDEKPNCQGKRITGDRGYQSSWTVSGFVGSDKGIGNLFNGKDDADTLKSFGGSIGFTQTSFKGRNRKEMEFAIKKAGASLSAACVSSFSSKKTVMSGAAIQRECSGEKLVAWAQKIDPKSQTFANLESLKALQQAIWAQTDPMWDWGLSGSVSRKKLSYIDITRAVVGAPADGTVGFAKFVNGTNKFESSKTEWSVEAHIGAFGQIGDKAKEANVYGAIFAEVGQEFKEGDKSNVCPVQVATAVPVICQNLILTEAEKNKFARLGLQGKVQLPGWSVFPKFGIAPRFSIDLKGKKLKQWELPISLISDKEGSLNAGIKLSDEWGGSKIDPLTLERSDPSDGFTVGLFVGKAFNVGF
ncbi:hypothetical protein [Parasphingorhabdus sp.]|uniref:hypothetical protein n=1 Tax=Parasphingorhabdus sp. TaxID=2709688 RepID=UPI003D291B27